MERSEILNTLSADVQSKIDLTVVESISSTNDYFKDQIFHSDTDELLKVIISDTQTQGRGRFGHVWFSPKGENLYLSCQKQFKGTLDELSGLSLVLSLAIVKTLEPFLGSHSLKIKWPNDILVNNCKLCGSLIEIRPLNRVIMGIGININMMADNNHQISQAWTSLKKITGMHCNRNEIAAALITQLISFLPKFEQAGFSYFQEQWSTYDLLLGNKLNLKSGLHKDAIITGIARGLNAQGHLVLELEGGHYQAFSSGDTSMINLVYY